MTEILTQQEAYSQPLDQEVGLEQMSPLQLERQQLSLALVDKNLIPGELYESGALENFAIDEATQTDALKHLLTGDENGGAHHLPTLIELGVENVSIASMIQPQESLKRQMSPGLLRKEQKIKENGTFKALDIRVSDTNGNTLRKVGGSTMFPNEWSTQQVIESILQASQVPGEEVEDKNITRHTSKINGVKIVAVTDNKTGKILTGYPR
jgi:hypothetical protein